MLQQLQDGQAPDRRSHILDAAERCFVRTGFHRATMQDIAAEAAMSPGNLYRYFRSKDAMVEGLAERDRKSVAQDFAAFQSGGDFMSMFVALGRKHFEEEPREKAILCLEIWAEATRNPAFAALSAAFEHEVTDRLAGLLEAARARGEISASVDPRAVATLISTLADGLYVRRAIIPGFDAKAEVARVMGLIGAMLNGVVTFPTRPGHSEPSS